MGTIEELLRRRKELIEEIDREIVSGHTREVTLLFTDIVGSTSFYERMGDIAGRQMVQTHNDLLFPVISGFGGRVIKTIGDSIMASFEDPGQAVRCTVDMQKAIQVHNGKVSASQAFRVRMGLHRGRAVVEEKDLFGDVVNTAARVESRADGDEILVSGSMVEGALSAGCPVVFLGAEAVKGKEETVDFYLVNWRGRTEADILESWKTRQAGKHTGQGSTPDAAEAAGPARDRREPAGAGSSGGRRESGGPTSGTGRITIMGRPDPRRELESLPRLSARGNPYLNRVMVSHPDMFFGRKALLRRIMSRISASNPQSVSLVGERRIGKSSLLNHLRSPKARLELLEEPDGCLPLFMDFQQTRALDEGEFFSLLLAEMRRTFAGIIELELPANADGMRALCQSIAEHGLRLVFLFDEFECVTKNAKIGPEFYSFLRSLANNFPVSFITASGRDLKDMCVSHEISDSPFFNIFSVQHLGPFQREDAEELVEVPSRAHGIPLGPLSQRIVEMGGLYPIFLQMASSVWFEYLENEGRTAEDFSGLPTPREVIEAFREESRPHFEFILESAAEAEHAVFRSCAAAGSVAPSIPSAKELERKGYLCPKGEILVPFSAEFLAFLRSAFSC